MIIAKDETFGLTKESYPANKEVDRKWKEAVKTAKCVPGKYGAITIKVSK